jgi:hypothetical protein
MLKLKVWVATAMLTLLGVSDAWAAPCECKVQGLDRGLALSIWNSNGTNAFKYLQNKDRVILVSRRCWPRSGLCWADIDRLDRLPPASGWVRNDYVRSCQCDDNFGYGGTPRSPPPPPQDGDTPQSTPPPPK